MSYQPWWVLHDPWGVAFLLSLLPLLANFDLLRYGGWVSDDIDGILGFDGKLRDPKTQRYTWTRTLSWVRHVIGRSPNPEHLKDKTKLAFLPNPRKHHALSIGLSMLTSALAYLWLRQLIGSNLAVLAVALWSVHPVASQVTQWPSGIGYGSAAFFLFSSLNVAWALGVGWWGALAFAPLFMLGLYCQFTVMCIVPVLLYLHAWPVAGVALLCSLWEARRTYRNAVAIRTKNFTDQQMGGSTKFHLRRLIFAVKTWGYYCRHLLWPKRMGLYHSWNYHNPPTACYATGEFWAGLALAASAVAAGLSGPPSLTFALVWMGCFLFFVLNWITVMQVVTERYAWLPALGMCLAVATVAPLWLVLILFGCALARTWAHLPTYYDDERFYLSNIWNFPQSEVAYGNLGVTWLRMGFPGAAADAWTRGSRLNPGYDVPSYNLYSLFRSNGQLDVARAHLVTALSAPTCHFPDLWSKELSRLDAERAFYQQSMQVPEPQRLAWQAQWLHQQLLNPHALYRDLWRTMFEQAVVKMKQQPAAQPGAPT